jgi:hypothetical protein
VSLMTPDNRMTDLPPETQRPPEPEPRPAARPAAPPSGPVYFDPLNLSRRPFLNSRPVVRVSLILFLLGLILLLVNVSLFWGYLSSSKDMRADIVKGEQEVDRQRDQVRRLEARLDDIPLTDLNTKILFLNGKIQDRTFSFNQLLDHLGKVLPNDVRLNRLIPLTGDQAGQAGQSRGARRVKFQDGRVPLQIVGETRDVEALDQFVQNLFAPPFAEPNLARQEKSDDENVWRFDVTVQYIPGSQSQGVVVEEVPVIEEEAPPAGSAPPARAPGIQAPGGRP